MNKSINKDFIKSFVHSLPEFNGLVTSSYAKSKFLTEFKHVVKVPQKINVPLDIILFSHGKYNSKKKMLRYHPTHGASVAIAHYQVTN